MAPKLGYWKLRGIGQPIRLLLEYLGQEYEEVQYVREPNKWTNEDKQSLPLDFPNLPYYIDGDLKLTESTAILTYIAEKHNMIGNTPEDRAKMNMLIGTIVDLRMSIARPAYRADWEELKPSIIESIPKKLEVFSKFLGEKPYLTGEKITHADLYFYETLDCLCYLVKTCLDEFPNLKKFYEAIESEPRIAAYKKSDRFVAWPLHGWVARFGGGEAPPSQ